MIGRRAVGGDGDAFPVCPERVQRGDVSMTMWYRSSIIALVVALAAVRGEAQAAPATAPPAVHDTTLHKLALDATKVQSMQSAYRLLMVRDTVSSPIGEQQFGITTMDYAGTPALMLARSGTQGVTTVSDSLVVRRDDLRPLHWIASQGVAHIAVELTPDSVYGAMTSPLGKQNVVLPNRGDLLVSTMGVDVVVSAVPLSSSWRDSANVLLIDSGGAAEVPVTLAVEGEEHVTVPAGDFDCWIVGVETERASERLWVTKQGQIVVRAEQILPELDGSVLTRVLLRTDNPALVPASARLPQ